MTLLLASMWNGLCIRVVALVSTFMCMFNNFRPMYIEYWDSKKETSVRRPVGSWFSYTTGAWKSVVNDLLTTKETVHVTYRYNNRPFTYVARHHISHWPPYEKKELQRPLGFNDHLVVVMAVLVDGHGKLRDVTSDINMFLGIQRDFHGCVLTPKDLFLDMSPKGCLLVTTLTDKHMVRHDKPIILT